MDNIYIGIIIFVYFLLLFFSYIFMIKRLKYLNEKHIEYTKVAFLGDLYKELKGIILLLLIALFIVGSFIIVTFF